jgi:hypothetical protein
VNRHFSPTVPPPSSHVENALRVLVLHRGRLLETFGPLEVHEVHGSCFALRSPDQRVLGPFGGLDDLFLRMGTRLFRRGGNSIYELEGWVLSVDAEGYVAGPYPDFDEWVWTEAETVSREPLVSDRGGIRRHRYVHRWQDLYFLTVDPLPCPAVCFPSVESALAHGRRLAFLPFGSVAD